MNQRKKNDLDELYAFDYYLAGHKSRGRFARFLLDNFIKSEIQRPIAETVMKMRLVMREVWTSFPRKKRRREPRVFCPPRWDSLSFSSLENRRCARSAGCVSCFFLSLFLSCCVGKLNKNNDITVRRGWQQQGWQLPISTGFLAAE